MDKLQKTNEIAELKSKFEESPFFYICDASTLTVEKTNQFRRLCYNKGVEFRVAKNTLIKKALEQISGGYEALYPSLNGPTGILFAKEEASVPAKILKQFREKNERPVLKSAYIDSDIFIGDNQIAVLAALKSKSELLGEVISLLQSPAKNVISGLQASGGQKIAALLQTLEKRGE